MTDKYGTCSTREVTHSCRCYVRAAPECMWHMQSVQPMLHTSACAQHAVEVSTAPSLIITTSATNCCMSLQSIQLFVMVQLTSSASKSSFLMNKASAPDSRAFRASSSLWQLTNQKHHAGFRFRRIDHCWNQWKQNRHTATEHCCSLSRCQNTSRA